MKLPHQIPGWAGPFVGMAALLYFGSRVFRRSDIDFDFENSVLILLGFSAEAGLLGGIVVMLMDLGKKHSDFPVEASVFGSVISIFSVMLFFILHSIYRSVRLFHFIAGEQASN